jgi:hypothetical protein
MFVKHLFGGKDVLQYTSRNHRLNNLHINN